MPINFLLPIIPIDAFTFEGADAPETFWQDGQGDSWDQNGTAPTFSFTPDSMVPVSVDTELGYSELGYFSDDPDWDQTLETGITLNGEYWPAGYTIEPEYAIDVHDENGNMFRAYAISINH